MAKFGPAIARRLRRRRPRPSNRWHLDEMVVRIAGERMYLWRAVDCGGQVLDMLAQRRRDVRAALRLMRKLLKKQGFAPRLLVIDKLRSYASAFRQLGLTFNLQPGPIFGVRFLGPCTSQSRKSANPICRGVVVCGGFRVCRAKNEKIHVRFRDAPDVAGAGIP